MLNRTVSVALTLSVVISGCASSGSFLQEMQATATDMAVRRGQFELSCPSATGDLLSSDTVPPLVNTFRWRGPERAEYTVGVSGCGKRATYIVICPDDGDRNCFAGAGRTEVQ